MRLDRICVECGSEFSVEMPVRDAESGVVKDKGCPYCGTKGSLPTMMGQHDEPSVWNQLP